MAESTTAAAGRPNVIIRSPPSALSSESDVRSMRARPTVFNSDVAGGGAAGGAGDAAAAAGGGVPSKTMRGKQYYQAMITEPPLYFTPVGKRWSVDVFAVSNNAVRAELNDMYYIVQSMIKRKYDLSHDDIDEFYMWFEVFNFFVQGIFELQEQAIFSVLDEKLPSMPAAMTSQARKDFRETITYDLRKIDEYQPRFQMRPPGEVLPQMVEYIDDTVPRLLRYYRDMEKELPPLLEAQLPEDSGVFKNLTMRLIAGQQDPHWFFVLYQRGEPRKLMRKEMRHSYFRLRSILTRYAWKKGYVRMKAKVKDVHFDIVKEFWRRWREAKLEVDEEEAQAHQNAFVVENVQRDKVRQMVEREESDEDDEDEELVAPESPTAAAAGGAPVPLNAAPQPSRV